MRPERPAEEGAPWSGDAGARRLLASVQGACAGGGDLPTRLEAGLRAALGMLAAEPEVAYQLTIAPYLGSDEQALDSQRAWMARFGDLLSDAAASDPRTAPPPVPILGSFLIGGVRFQICRLVLSGEASELPRLLPLLLEGLLAYYFEPGEPRLLARGALGAQG